MFEIINIDEEYFAKEISEAQKAQASAYRYSEIYSHKTEYYLSEAIGVVHNEARKAINYDDPKYAPLHISARDLERRGSSPNLSIGYDHEDVPMQDIATKTRHGWEVEGYENLAKYETRNAILNAVGEEVRQRPEIQRIRAIKNSDSGTYAALNAFAHGNGDPFTALANFRDYADKAISGIYGNNQESHERRELTREMEQLANGQEKLLVQLSHSLLIKRRDAIQSLVDENIFSDDAQKNLHKALDAANQSIQFMKKHAKAIGLQHGKG